MVPSQKNTLSIISVLQPKTLNFHYFILKVPCFLTFYFWALMTTTIFLGQFHRIFYRVRVNKTGFLIFKLMFVQESQMILLPQVQTIVMQFLDITWCVKFLQIIATFTNTGKVWLHQTLQPVVWLYAARMIRIFFILLTAVRWLKMYAHLKNMFNGISSSHLPVTQEKSCYKTNSWMTRW